MGKSTFRKKKKDVVVFEFWSVTDCLPNHKEIKCTVLGKSVLQRSYFFQLVGSKGPLFNYLLDKLLLIIEARYFDVSTVNYSCHSTQHPECSGCQKHPLPITNNCLEFSTRFCLMFALYTINNNVCYLWAWLVSKNSFYTDY